MHCLISIFSPLDVQIIYIAFVIAFYNSIFDFCSIFGGCLAKLLNRSTIKFQLNVQPNVLRMVTVQNSWRKQNDREKHSQNFSTVVCTDRLSQTICARDTRKTTEISSHQLNTNVLHRIVATSLYSGCCCCCYYFSLAPNVKAAARKIIHLKRVVQCARLCFVSCDCDSCVVITYYLFAIRMKEIKLLI